MDMVSGRDRRFSCAGSSSRSRLLRVVVGVVSIVGVVGVVGDLGGVVISDDLLVSRAWVGLPSDRTTSCLFLDDSDGGWADAFNSSKKLVLTRILGFGFSVKAAEAGSLGFLVNFGNPDRP